MKTAKSLTLALMCVCLVAWAQVPTYTVRQSKSVVDSKVTLDIAPLPDSLIVMSTTPQFALTLAPSGVASQWTRVGYATCDGVGPFTATNGVWVARVTSGRTPPKIPVTIEDWSLDVD